MSSVDAFKLVLICLIAMVGLQLLATRLRLPPAAALLLGGTALAFLPGLPPITLDPDLVLIVFLPPLLMNGAYFSVWDDLKSNFASILLLAVGAVVFTTLCVGLALHWVIPALPWAACFALGAIVSPPDAVAAKAVLERLALPRRLTVLLEGESLLNDAAGLVLVRFAVSAALTGAFSASSAALSFGLLALGGIAVGGVVAYALIKALKYLNDDFLMITITLLASWISYIVADFIGVSSVISTVTCGLAIGWYQHELFSAAARLRGTSFWAVMVFLLEALVFILIGLSLRGVVTRLEAHGALPLLIPAVATVIVAVIVSRFVYVFGIDGVGALVRRLRGDATRTDWKATTILGWAGMRGVVTLAVALGLPDSMPGRDMILVASFAVIFVTVVIQGSTIGAVIRWVAPDDTDVRNTRHLNEPQAWAHLEAAQLGAIESLVRDAEGKLIHPRLFEQYSYRAQLSKSISELDTFPTDRRIAHYDIVLAAIAAGREELLRLHRAGMLHDELMHALERDLDLQEISARHNRG
ncbi:cation:proton antiporter [Pararobbsia silviterrae]|uniref:Sodium:proton antiporter n=1 Tax=Pararobbsia silviterrae TaxID=1792498 RepID=A0A494XZB5_9BURK|nr:sodium:proton antiporter [Pararobbsia silviterrae]RKP55904.1 sodium:proton antiporter [Pararobbsia silviterrae]